MALFSPRSYDFWGALFVLSSSVILLTTERKRFSKVMSKSSERLVRGSNHKLWKVPWLLPATLFWPEKMRLKMLSCVWSSLKSLAR
jgi:hypothetical protein